MGKFLFFFIFLALLLSGRMPAQVNVRSNAVSEVQIFYDDFNYNDARYNSVNTGRKPTRANLPDTSWLLAAGKNNYEAVVQGKRIDPRNPYMLKLHFAAASAIPLKAKTALYGSSVLKLSADLKFSKNPFSYILLGFYSKLAGENTYEPLAFFSGLQLNYNGSITLYENGIARKNIPWLGEVIKGKKKKFFNPLDFSNLSFEINTDSGTIYNVKLTGSSARYNFVSRAFNESATAYAGVGGKTGLFNIVFVDNFKVSETISSPDAPVQLEAVAGNASVTLSWQASPKAESYTIYRSNVPGDKSPDQIISEITSLDYTDTGLINDSTYFYRVKAVANGVFSNFSNEASATPSTPASDPVIPHEGMTVFATSEQNSSAETALATFAIDNNVNTFWHTRWDPAPDSLPQSITLNIGDKYNIEGLIYTPRQNSENGRIVKFNILVSEDGNNFRQVITGIWPNSASEKVVYFNTTDARYVKLEALEGILNVATAAEINILRTTKLPRVPSDLTAVAGEKQVVLNWAESERASAYNIFRSNIRGSYPDSAIASGIKNTTYTDTGLANGVEYYYRIKAMNNYGSSSLSNEVSAKPFANQGVNLALGKNVKVSSVEGGGSLTGNLAVDGNNTTRWASDFTDPSWIYADMDSIRNISRVVLDWEAAYGRTFLIQISTDASNWETVYGSSTGNGGRDDISFSGRSARYVRMYGIQRATGYGYSLYEFEVYSKGYSVPAAPASLSAIPGNAQVKLTWTAVPNASGYSIFRSTDSLNYTIVASGITSADYTNTGLLNNKTYYYKVLAERVDGDVISASTFSNTASALTVATAPQPPSGLIAKAGRNRVVLDWSASDGAESYNVYRSVTFGTQTETPVANGITNISYIDTGLINDTTYYYKVKAVNEAGLSGFSEEVSVRPTPHISFYTITNAWLNNGRNGYLYDNQGINVSYGTLGTGNEFLWILEDMGGGYQRVKNRATGSYMNIAEGETNVKCSDIAETDSTSLWLIKNIEGNSNKSLRNKGNSKFLNVENQLGYVTCDMSAEPSGNNLFSAQWILTYAGGEGIPVKGVTLLPSSATVYGYGEKQMKAVLSPGNASNTKLRWSSSNPEVASVSSTGIVSATKTGTTTIDVITEDGDFKATSEIIISEVPVNGIQIVPSSTSVFMNKTKVLTAIVTPDSATDKVFTWSSSNPSVATVSIHGGVTGIAEGTALITATTRDGSRKASCTVTVREAGNATPAADFLKSIGANTAISTRGENLPTTVEIVNYLGLGFIRHEGGDYTSANELYRQTGAKINYLVGGAPEFSNVIENARQMAEVGSLLSIEGPNEPNTWRITYQGQEGGGDISWLPVMKYQRDLYKAIKNDSVLKYYPVWMFTDNGAEFDNAGAQFITIPKGSGALMPEGTQLAEYATLHNYFSHSTYGSLVDNITWRAASAEQEPNNLYENYGVTWKKFYKGYQDEDLLTLPKVTTETGITVGTWNIDEEMQGKLLLNCYLSQFKRGYSYTAVYILRDRTDESGNQTFGFYRGDYTPRPAATYLHNMTTILSDEGSITPGQVDYSIPDQKATTHDLLLQKSNGTYELIVWGERYSSGGSDDVTVYLGETFENVKVYDPLVGTDPVKTYQNVDSVKISVSDHPVIIEFYSTALKRGPAASNNELLSVEESDKDEILNISYLKDNSVNIEVKLEEEYIIRIVNMNSKVVRTLSGNNTQLFNLKKGDFPEGVYVVSVINSAGKTSRKIIMH